MNRIDFTRPALHGRALAALLGIGLSMAATAAIAAPTIEKSVKVAPGLYELVANSQNGTVLVASAGARGGGAAKIVVLDGKTLESRSSIDVSSAPLYGLGLNEATQTLYGTATRDGVVSAIDLRKGEIASNIRQGENAHLREVIVDEGSHRVYASIVGGRDSPSAIWVIDGKTHALLDSINVEGTLTGIALDASAQKLYGTLMSENQVAVVDLAQKKVVQQWAAGGERPTNIVLDPAGHRLLIANQQSGSLSVLDAQDGKLLKSVSTGKGALSVAFNPRKQQIYVANREAGTVSVIDAKTYEVLASLSTGTLPQTIAIDRRTDLVYVSNKARGLPRNAPAGTPPVEDPAGDTVTLIRP